MKINVKQLAKLANLTLSEKQLHDLEESIPSVVSYMDEVKNLDVDSIEETSRVTEESNVLREDVITKSFSQEEALQNAKKTHKGFFVVPNVFEKKEE